MINIYFVKFHFCFILPMAINDVPKGNENGSANSIFIRTLKNKSAILLGGLNPLFITSSFLFEINIFLNNAIGISNAPQY